MDTPSSAVGPGLGAFVAFFVLAVALWLLMRNMNARMRRIAYREQQRVAELESPEAGRPEAEPPARQPERGDPRERAEPPGPAAQAESDDTP